MLTLLAFSFVPVMPKLKINVHIDIYKYVNIFITNVTSKLIDSGFIKKNNTVKLQNIHRKSLTHIMLLVACMVLFLFC